MFCLRLWVARVFVLGTVPPISVSGARDEPSYWVLVVALARFAAACELLSASYEC